MSGYWFNSAGPAHDDKDCLTCYATRSMDVRPMIKNPTHELLTAGGQSIATDPKGMSKVLSSSLIPQASQLSPVARTGTGGSVVYVQHDQQTIADYPVGGVASTPTCRYVYASYIDEPVVRKAAGTSGTIHYYHRNQQYSITAMTTSTGAVAERYAYTAYGQPTILNASGSVLTSSAVGNRYTYTGREWNETLGLHHFRARWMSPLAGRFLTRDPIGYVGSKWGLYEFLDGHGLKAFDPFGKVKITTVEDELSHPITECTKGKQLGMAYLFEVENKCPGGDGWIVQEITVQCNVNKCKESKECPRKGSGKSVHFFEAWRITDGATNPNDPSPNYTDVSPFTINKDTCGYFRADGEVRFICDEDIPAGTGPETWGKDTEIDKRDPGPNCPVIVTGGLPTSHETPGWWGASREASAKRFYEVTWSNCCMCNIQQDGEPKK